MTARFHEGQEVEVLIRAEIFHSGICTTDWRKAKIVRYVELGSLPKGWLVQLPDGTRAVFDADHIRAARGKFDEWPSPPVSTTTTEWSS